MSDTITVRFGEREVVLNSIGDDSPCVLCLYYSTDENRILRLEFNERTKRWHGMVRIPIGDLIWCDVLTGFQSPQEAIAAVESKLLALRDELNRLIGGGK